jgi:hypothetical protein
VVEITKDLKAREGEEIWETTTETTSWFRATDDRGRERSVSVGGKVGARLRISTIDREINQDLAMHGGDPFSNGLLRRVDDTSANNADTLTNQQLMVGFSKNGRAFQAFVEKLTELNVRRMRTLANEIDATVAQVAHLDQVIKDKFRIEGDTPSYREYKAV